MLVGTGAGGATEELQAAELGRAAFVIQSHLSLRGQRMLCLGRKQMLPQLFGEAFTSASGLEGDS